MIDAEISQLGFYYGYRVNPCWQVGIESEWIAYSGGVFDKPVDQWHEFFGLPDANRGIFPFNQLLVQYQQFGVQQFRLDQATNGAGDVHLQVQHRFGCSANSAIARAGVKLPLGASAVFPGSNSTDFYADWHTAWRQPFAFSAANVAATFGLLLHGESGNLPEKQSVVGFGTAALNYTLSPSVTLLAQMDWHTAVFKSDLTELGNAGLQATFGLRILTKGGHWELSFSEDVVIDTAPDIGLRLAWRTARP